MEKRIKLGFRIGLKKSKSEINHVCLNYLYYDSYTDNIWMIEYLNIVFTNCTQRN